MSSVPSPEDPFDNSHLERLRLSQNFGEMAPTKEVLTSVACRKPNKKQFIRVAKGEDRRFPTFCLTDDETKDVYLVSPDLCDALKDEIVPTLLVICQTRLSRVPFFWPLTLPTQNSKGHSWHQSALEIALIAETQWTRVIPDMDAGCYIPKIAEAALPEPDWSLATDMSQMLRLAFRERYIDSLDHLVVKRLRGLE